MNLPQINVKSNFLAFKEATTSSSSGRNKDAGQELEGGGLSPSMAKLSMQTGMVPQGVKVRQNCYKMLSCFWPFSIDKKLTTLPPRAGVPKPVSWEL